MNDPTSIPAALVGIHTIIDCATARPEESAQKIDWDAKVALIQSAQVSSSSNHLMSHHAFHVHPDMTCMHMSHHAACPAQHLDPCNLPGPCELHAIVLNMTDHRVAPHIADSLCSIAYMLASAPTAKRS